MHSKAAARGPGPKGRGVKLPARPTDYTVMPVARYSWEHSPLACHWSQSPQAGLTTWTHDTSVPMSFCDCPKVSGVFYRIQFSHSCLYSNDLLAELWVGVCGEYGGQGLAHLSDGCTLLKEVNLLYTMGLWGPFWHFDKEC